MSTPPALPLLHSAFYRFAPLADPAALAARLRAWAPRLHGSIVLAAEGISGTVAGTPAVVAEFEASLQQTEGLGLGWPAGQRPSASPAETPGDAGQRMRFTHSACRRSPFGRLKVSVKPELVALGLPPAPDGPWPPPDGQDASHLAPLAWRALLDRDDVVLLDNRNHFEYRLGHFRGAQDPQVAHFRDFVAYVQGHAPEWRAAQRPVAMYCTGGIRCDKTAPWMRSLGLTVWQLDGGILNYCQSLPDADRDWLGDCFVFDKRVALDSALRESGTSAEQVFDAQRPDEAWRLQRARRLAAAPDA